MLPRGVRNITGFLHVICLLTLLLNVPLAFNAQQTELVRKQQCDSANRNVLLSSLMSGDVVALDLESGQKLWQVSTGDKLLSSSISTLEVIYNGMSTRLVPSLDGSLFRFHDDVFEPLPFTAETLLSSSFKLAGESTVVVGAKELRTVGLNPSCGQLLYKCDKEGCDNRVDVDPTQLDILTIKHTTHTVRAASVRHGTEKWNFSVGHHEVSFTESSGPHVFSGSNEEACDSQTRSCPSAIPELKFSVPDGMVTRRHGGKSSESMWQYQFQSPISKSWVLRQGQLHEVDLLDPKYIQMRDSIHFEEQPGEQTEENQLPPSIYVGVYKNQVYIQPSDKIQNDVSAIAEQYKRGAKIFTSIPKVRWAPYIASAPSRTPLLNYGRPDPTVVPPTQASNSEPNALSILHPNLDYPHDQGYYLRAEVSSGLDIPDQPDQDKPTEGDELWDGFGMDDLERILNVQVVSLWFYWKEVLAISMLFAVLLNCFLYLTRAHRRRLKNKLKCFGSEQDLSDVSDVSDDERRSRKKRSSGKSPNRGADRETETVTEQPPAQAVSPAPPPPPPSTPQYQSRYQSDFDHIQCLGKGGFGVVFHAQNALDECDYAIKRITLPNNDEAKVKVTREVKALAKLDHPNIVRYFQSWFETPPIGWQEEHDKIWESTEKFMPTPMNSVTPFSRQQSLFSSDGNANTADQAKSVFIPKFKLDDLNTSASFGLPSPLEDSFDIVFASQSGAYEKSVSVATPFHKYTTVAPLDTHSDTSDSESDNEWHQLDDSGYHKNKMAMVESTGSFGDEVSWDDTETSFHQSEHSTPKSNTSVSKTKPKEPHSKLFLYIQMQLCKRETLRDYLNANTLVRDKSDIVVIFRQICDAVSYIHSQGLIHRDLKPTNIFFSLEDSIKVGDFGLVTALSAYPDEQGGGEGLVSGQTPAKYVNLTNNVGTQIYMSPEQMAGRMYNSKVDIYALGLVFFELKYPFSTMMERVMTLQNIKKHKYPERFVRELPEEHKFVKWMLHRNPNKRPSITEVIDSEIMSGAAELVVQRIRNRTVSRSSSNE